MADFGQALIDINNGDKVKRTSWNIPNFIVMFDPMSGSPASGVVIMQDITGIPVSVWQPQNVDIIADDWEVVV